jgi:16S rRNA (adenine1518-N6/adenine1519-N6)-dimethyltransferase
MLNTVCLSAFNQRRKTIRNSFKKLISHEILQDLNIDATLRPENLAVDDFIRVANYLSDNPVENK